MVLLRPFTEADNAALLEIDRLSPQGNERIAEAMDKSPDIIARYRLYDNWKVFVAEDDGRVAGWMGWILKQNPDGGKYAYLAEAIIHPKFRRRGIATALMEKAETDLKQEGASHAYAYVFEENDASNAMCTKNGYTKTGEIQMQAISVYKKVNVSPDFSIRPARMDDIQGIVDLVNKYNSGRKHFVPYTVNSFESHVKSIPGYGMENLWVALSDTNIIACTGLWDISSMARIYYAKEPVSMRILGVVFSFLDHFTSMPKVPAENELFDLYYLTDHAFQPDGFDAMSNLIKHLNNIVLEKQRYFMTALLTPDDPLVPVIKQSKPLVEKWNVFVKSLDGGNVNIDPLYPDIRDFIM